MDQGTEPGQVWTIHGGQSFVVLSCSGKSNPADMASKHWAHNDVKGTLRTIVFWEGDSAKMEECDAKKKQKMEEAAAKKKALANTKGTDDSKPPAEGSERRASTHKLTLL